MRRAGGDRQSGPELAAGLAVLLWQYRLELGSVALAVAGQRLLAGRTGDVIAAVAVTALLAALAVIAPVRRLAWRALRRSWVRRAWERASIDAGLCDGPLHAPRLLAVERVPAVDLLRVRVRGGQSATALDARCEELAASLRVREIRVQRDRSDAATAHVTLVRRDPFEAAAPASWPTADVEERSLWDPIALGVDEHGRAVEICLVERNVLVGGEPGAGKSVALSLLVAAAALDREARVWLLDGKLVELAAWAPVAERLVGPDGEQAITVLHDVQVVMEDRYRERLACGLRKVRREDGLPLHLIVVDELAFYPTLPDRKQRQQFAELLRDLVARGRAAGVIVVAATQKPGADVVPTALRDLFGFRLALRCNTPQASDTILGQGWATAGADASTIPGGQRGVGWLLAEGERPQRIKGYHLTDEQIAAIAERAAARRADAWLTAATSEVEQERQP
ncbi:MAG: FtsK/SpoIIIE domain-containing protein [Solirubrobacteraceae bacterium]